MKIYVIKYSPSDNWFYAYRKRLFRPDVYMTGGKSVEDCEKELKILHNKIIERVDEKYLFWK